MSTYIQFAAIKFRNNDEFWQTDFMDSGALYYR